VLGEVLDDLADQVLRRGVIDTAHRSGNVDHRVVFNDAEFKIVEEYQFHSSPFLFPPNAPDV